ncbi:MAG: aldehyde oxidase [Acidiferrobacteraceae bacterium]|nr:aldehyde oxidase [Acidiferrobacteraceae bacterium]
MANWKKGRRNFLISAVVIGGSVTAAMQFGLPYLRRKAFDFLSEGGPPGGGTGDNPALWISIDTDNTLHLQVPKVEMGQGVHTALGQIVAEELEVSWERVSVSQGSTLTGPVDSFGTGGSASISGLYLPLRQLTANYRSMLITAVSEEAGMPVQLSKGVFSASGKMIMTLAEATRLDRDWVIPEDDAPLKPASEFKLIGKSVPRVDYLDMLTGIPHYAYDLKSSKQKTYYGAVAKPPKIGAVLENVRTETAKQMQGVIEVIEDGEFVGIIGESRESAWLACDALDIKWQTAETIDQDSLDFALDPNAKDSVVLKKTGDLDFVFSNPNTIRAEYSTPFAATALLEPQSSFAELIENDILRVRTPTQFPNTTASNIAKRLGIEEHKVEVIPTYLGGGFGRRSKTESAIEAAVLAYKTGLPVHVGWRREDEFLHDRFRPPTRHILHGLVEKSGHISGIQHLQASGDVLLSDLPSIAASILGSDFGATRGINVAYEIPSLELRAKRTPLPVPTASWRGLGLLANTFATESFIDELAVSASEDPLSFRIKHLPQGDKIRLRNALQRVGKMADWNRKRPTGTGLGVACCQDYGTVIAQVAEVSVESGDIRVLHIWAVMDCGLAVNPDGAINQVEGNIVWGLGSALHEEITFFDNKPLAQNFDKYPLLRLSETPRIKVELIQSELPPQGVGEPAIGPVPAAVANAVYAASGKRLRSLPLRL